MAFVILNGAVRSEESFTLKRDASSLCFPQHDKSDVIPTIGGISCVVQRDSSSFVPHFPRNDRAFIIPTVGACLSADRESFVLTREIPLHCVSLPESRSGQAGMTGSLSFRR